jgi:hypothetical protein
MHQELFLQATWLCMRSFSTDRFSKLERSVQRAPLGTRLSTTTRQVRAVTWQKSILTNATRVDAVGIDSKSVGDWIRLHTDRVNLLVPVATGPPILSLLEAFLQVRWKPLFEGRSECD